MKTFLTIDTATDVLYVSVMKAGKITFESSAKGNKDHAIKLMPTVIEALKKSGLQGAMLEGILVGIGPGSYTGVRMGVVVAKMLAKEWHIPLYKISTLALMASAGEGQMMPMIDARNDHVFGAVYELSTPAQVILEPGYYSKATLTQTYLSATQVESVQPSLEKVLSSGLYSRVENVDALTPNYVRKTQAEKERHGA